MRKQDLLTKAIREQADKADANRLHLVDIRALAVTLHSQFHQVSEADVLDKVRAEFTARKLLWQ